MSNEKIITRKIEIYINQINPSKKKDEVKSIKEWMSHSRNYANGVMTLLHSVKFLDKVNETTSSNIQGSFSEYMDCSKQNLGYKVFTGEYKNLLPSTFRATINTFVYKKYNTSYKDVLSGKSSIPSFKRNFPLLFGSKSIRQLTIDGFDFFSINFKFKFGRDRSNNREIVQRVIGGDYKMCDSSLLYDFDDRKFYLFLTVKIPVTQEYLNEQKVMGVDLGLKFPAYVSINSDDNFRQSIGTPESFLVGRLSIQKQRRQLQKNLKFTNGGRGRNKKMDKLDSLGTKERNYVKNQNHIISKEIIRLALQNKCYAINIEDLSGIGKNVKNSYVLRNWSYYELQNMIKTKANAVGIKVNVIDPRYSSQRCSKCGHIHEDNRETQSEFVCQECGFVDNADFNASKNISIADTKVYKDEIKKHIKKIGKKVDDLDF
jgi:putative transposase